MIENKEEILEELKRLRIRLIDLEADFSRVLEKLGADPKNMMPKEK